MAEKGARCLGIPETITSAPLTLNPKAAAGSLQGSSWKSALTWGVQAGKEQVVLQWHGTSSQLLAPRSWATTDNSVSC